MEAPLRGPWTLPNFITLLRLAALPFFLVSISDGRFDIALAIFVVAGLSDGVDGYLARHFDMKSALGAYLDPIADKLLLISSYLFLAVPSYPALFKVPVWLAVMVLSRDFLLLLVALLMISTVATAGWSVFRPRPAYRLASLLGFALVGAALLAEPWWTLTLSGLAYALSVPLAMLGFARSQARQARA